MSQPLPATGRQVVVPRKAYRRRTGRVLAGVAGGVADNLGVTVLWVRLAFALLAALGGAGVLGYAMLWLFVPQEPATAPVHAEDPKQRQQAFALVALGIALAIGVSSLSGLLGPWVSLPVGTALAGAAIVWREADQAQRRKPGSGPVAALFTHGGRSALLRVMTGVLFVVAGIGVLLLHGLDLGQVQFAAVAVGAALVAVAVLTVPWWLRLVRDLGDERKVRIRTQERAEIAAHLHDSVLQTLALIQKQSEAPREVLRLARGQERELRGWLYGPSGYSGGSGAGGARTGGTLASALTVVVAEVEDTFAIKVGQVVVGDAGLDGKLTSLVRACREAMVNAAKHAEVGEISVYAEVEPEQVELFVRDRGAGFDPAKVGADRHGLADSIRGRMQRNGGTVRLRTALGEGTEVQLRMPRSDEGVRT